MYRYIILLQVCTYLLLYNITFSFAFSINLTASSKSVQECTSSHNRCCIWDMLTTTLPSISLDISSNSSASDKGLILIDICSKTVIHEIFNLRCHRYSIASFYWVLEVMWLSCDILWFEVNKEMMVELQNEWKQRNTSIVCPHGKWNLEHT